MHSFWKKDEFLPYLCGNGIGEQLLGENENLEISHERLNQEQMEELILKNNKPLVNDATHLMLRGDKNIKATHVKIQAQNI